MNNKQEMNIDIANKVEKEVFFYWLNGFYDTPVEGAVKITQDQWQELLDSQSSGKEIRTNEDGFPILVEHEYTIEEMRDMKLSEIREYDKSEVVNQFTIGNTSGWLDKTTRLGLQNSISIEQETGKADTTLWIANKPFVLSTQKALDMLRQIELYAIACNNTTLSHIASVIELTDRKEVMEYNFKKDYPQKLEFAI